MAAVVGSATGTGRVERGRLPRSPRSPGSVISSKRRAHSKGAVAMVRSPKSVLLPDSSIDSSSESTSSLASSILGEQIVECTSSFRTTNSSLMKVSAKDSACFDQVDDYTWFVSIDRSSDLLVEVDDISFHLHKLPLLSRSGLLYRLASESCDSKKAYISLVDVPGGAEAFILVAKFCYGIVEELTPTNVAMYRCCAEYLEMTEEFEEENVVSKAEAYLNLVILNSWQESIIVLQSCELLLPWAEDMSLVKRCAQSVACKACTDPRGVRWLYSGVEKASAAPRVDGSVARVAPKDWWYEDVSHLTIYCFSEVVEAIKENGTMNAELLGGALEYYAQRWLLGLVKQCSETVFSTTSTSSTRRNSPSCSTRTDSVTVDLTNCPSKGTDAAQPESIAEQNRNRFILEEIVDMLPLQKDSVSCSFLLRMTRAAYMLNCDAACKADLERLAGLQLDQATLNDLLIPSFSHTSEYLYDIDVVHRIVDQFLIQEFGSPGSCSGDANLKGVYEGPNSATGKLQQPRLNVRARVAKLLDSYLAEVARDSKLPLFKFQSLAEALPEGSRLCDDGLYRAVDTYLKIHPTLSEHERKRFCRILNCQRLSLDACTHASQNERLPLRFVVQVLFCEQLKIRSTVTEVSNSVKEDRSNADNVSVTSRVEPNDQSTSQPSTSACATIAHVQAVQESANQMEIRALQRELATMKAKWNDLERDQGNIHEQVEQIASMTRGGRSTSWSSGAWKKIMKLHLFNHRDHNGHAPGESRWRNSIS